ncbi:MAG: tRNA lysidine(34) synthetase TilS [Marinomonas sp.]
MDSASGQSGAARFAASLDRLETGGGAVGVALSGGPDSIALLLLANAARPGKVHAATVDHGLRTESAQEAAFAAELCANLGIPHRVLYVDVASGNVQANARAARYAALGEWAADSRLSALMTAHHADDQAETLLMRLNRGSGISGLAGIRESTRIPAGGGDGMPPLIRPLLSWRKTDLEAIVSEAGITPVADPSNEDERFDRARIRKAIADADWLDPVKMATSAQHLSEADMMIGALADEEWEACVSAGEAAVHYTPSRGIAHPIGRVLALRILTRAVQHLMGNDGQSQGSGPAAAMLRKLELGEAVNVAGVLARAEKGAIVLKREPPRKKIS